MKILLVRPKPPTNTVGLKYVMVCEPLELEYMAASVAKQHQVIIIDLILERKTLAHFIQKHTPDLVGLTGYITHVNLIKEYARRIKSIRPDCAIVVGGVHAEVQPADYEDPHIDYIIAADAHLSFPQLVDRLSTDQSTTEIPGLWNPQLKVVPAKSISFPDYFPARELTRRYRSSYYYMFHNPCALIKTSYGCPYSCNFCFCIQITDEQYFARPIDDVIQEIAGISEPEIYIVDDNFLVSRERVLEFCDKLELGNIQKQFLIYGRADFIATNPDVMTRFKALGLRAVIVGLESWDQDELDSYVKKTSLETSERAVRILAENGIDCYGTFILSPDWSGEDFQKLYAWIRKLDLIFVNLQPLTPLPGTEIFETYVDSLIVERDNYEEWDLAHLVLKPSKLTPHNYYWNIVKLYYKITMRGSSIYRMLTRYGVWETLKLSRGATIVTIQYLLKIFAAWFVCSAKPSKTS